MGIHVSIIKCKMCGGNMQLDSDKTYGTCEHCGSVMTLPKAEDEQIANLFNRANNLRRQSEFDKAVAVYENILSIAPDSAEAHWGLVLSKYGIEYVENPSTNERVPTCNRVHVESILTDADYQAALSNAQDAYTRCLYEEEAKLIGEIQKGILAISSKEEPYDIFICYKETDESGIRTKDSALAQEIYYQLENEGYNVFFARISLEKKLGQQYEPYIFNALSSAKAMLVIGTKPEYFNSVWVKNEWSRYLASMKTDRERLLIPCYRDMDAYDLPDEMAMLQAQDMGKIGFVQDLLHGIRKVLAPNKPVNFKPSSANEAAQTTPAATTDALLERAFLFLEDGDYSKADEYFERVLDSDPKNAHAYVGKLCVELKIKKEASLERQRKPFDDMANYQKALRFADAEYRSVLELYPIESMYNSLVSKKSQPLNKDGFRELAVEFRKIKNYKDSSGLADECDAIADELRYNGLLGLMKKANKSDDYLLLAEAFRVINYKDSASFAEECANKAVTLEAEQRLHKEEQQRKIEERMAEVELRRKEEDYRLASERFEYLMDNKDRSGSLAFSTLAMRFTEMGGYKDAEIMAKKCTRMAIDAKAFDDEQKRLRQEKQMNEQQENKRRKEEQQSNQWASQGLCRHCGGQMSGLFTKKCKSCGKAN